MFIKHIQKLHQIIVYKKYTEKSNGWKENDLRKLV